VQGALRETVQGPHESTIGTTAPSRNTATVQGPPRGNSSIASAYSKSSADSEEPPLPIQAPQYMTARRNNTGNELDVPYTPPMHIYYGERERRREQRSQK